MTALVNHKQLTKDQLDWLSVEPEHLSELNGKLKCRFILGWWSVWDGTPEHLAEVNDIALNIERGFRKHFESALIHPDRIVKQGWRADPLQSRYPLGALLKQEPLEATLGYRWSIISPWNELQAGIHSFSEEYLEKPLNLEIVFEYNQMTIREKLMDKEIRKIEKDTGKVEKELKHLEKADKKRDKMCDYGAKMMKKKKK